MFRVASTKHALVKWTSTYPCVLIYIVDGTKTLWTVELWSDYVHGADFELFVANPYLLFRLLKFLVPLNRRPSETWRKNPFLLYRRTLLVYVGKLRIFCTSVARFCCTCAVTGGLLELVLLETCFNGRATDKPIYRYAMVTQVTCGVLKDRQRIIRTC